MNQCVDGPERSALCAARIFSGIMKADDSTVKDPVFQFDTF